MTQKDRACFHAKYVDDGMGMRGQDSGVGRAGDLTLTINARYHTPPPI